MDLLKTILVYLSMVYVSSVQSAPEVTPTPSAALPTPTAIVAAEQITPPPTATPAPTPSPTPVPTPNITPNTGYKTIKVGDRGDRVTEMQQRLLELGYYTGNVDGAFGNQTRRAVERFQYNNGLSVDGIAGKSTLTVLYESADVVYAPAEPTATPTARPSNAPTTAITETPVSTTAAPTFVPTPTPSAESAAGEATESPTDAASATVKGESTPAVADETTTAPTDEIATVAEVAPETAAPTETSVQTSPSVEPTVETDAPSETSTEAPAETPVEETIVEIEESSFVLAGSTEALTLKTNISATEDPIPLHAVLLGTDLYAPLFEILQNAGVVMIPASADGQEQMVFTILNDLYQINYTLADDGTVSGLVFNKNQQHQLVSLRKALYFDGIFYLPIDVISELTGVEFALDEETFRYTVTIPTEAAQ